MRDYYDDQFSLIATQFARSEIRELLKLVGRPGFISFAGGLPSPETFNVEATKQICADVLDSNAAQALQYSPTEGVPQLVDALSNWVKKDNINVESKNVLVTTASQQGLDLLGKVFLNPGDKLICGVPTYLGAIQAFRSYQAEFIGVPLDPQTGIDTEEVEDILKKDREGIKFVYVIPDFQNPAGVTVSLEKRKHLLEIADKYQVLIVEDSPYRELRYEGETLPSLLTMDEGQGRVLTLYTFSKIFVSGFRLGWAMGPENVIDKMCIAKQGTDLCTPAFNQLIAAEFINRGLLKKQIEENIKFYSKKQKIMLRELDEKMPDIDGLHWTKPEGGLFMWLSMPEGYDTTGDMMKRAIEMKLAYVIGRAFDPFGGSLNCMRINFSYPTEEIIPVGVERLAELIKSEVAATRPG